MVNKLQDDEINLLRDTSLCLTLIAQKKEL